MSRALRGALVLLLVACDRRAPLPEASAPPPAVASADGMCKEHGVLASVCTKCNPALVPVFQSKGDWCDEHGFPESFCPICHPERGGRPTGVAPAMTEDEGPADGTKIRFIAGDIAGKAGIEVAPATERARLVELTVTARVQYDATRVAEVNARAPGVIRAISADIGAKVERGALLASFASTDIGADQSRLKAARSRVRLAESNLARLRKLLDARLAAEHDVLAAQHELDAALAERSGAEGSLAVVGGVGGASRYGLSSPIAGVVTKRSATIGHMVSTEEVLFEIVDTSVMWAELDVPESEVARVAVGQFVTVVPDGRDGVEASGTLTYLAPEIDTHTRTVKGRVALANPDGALRANMFARARISIEGGEGTAVVVPRAALQRAKSVDLVFVKLADDLFEGRRVKVGVGDADVVEVTGRIAPGEQVATAGSFLLKTETLKESIGAGCCAEE